MRCHGSVVLIAHPGLTGIANESGLSGSTQWHNGCAVCGRSFTPKRNDAVTCSNTCRQRLYRPRHSSHSLAEHVIQRRSGTARAS